VSERLGQLACCSPSRVAAVGCRGLGHPRIQPLRAARFGGLDMRKPPKKFRSGELLSDTQRQWALTIVLSAIILLLACMNFVVWKHPGIAEAVHSLLPSGQPYAPGRLGL
jgi:hypothetical protein